MLSISASLASSPAPGIQLVLNIHLPELNSVPLYLPNSGIYPLCMRTQFYHLTYEEEEREKFLSHGMCHCHY
jgi:hypothetical protein